MFMTIQEFVDNKVYELSIELNEPSVRLDQGQLNTFWSLASEGIANDDGEYDPQFLEECWQQTFD